MAKRYIRKHTKTGDPVVRRRRKLKASVGRRPLWARKLTRLEYRFVSEYLVDLNKTQAYMRANPYPIKYQSAASGGLAMLRIERVKIALEEALEAELHIPKSRLIDELSAIAFCNPKDFVSWDRHGSVTFKDSNRINDSKVGAVTEVSRTANGLRLKFADKLPALQRLAAILGVTKEEKEGAGQGNLTINVVRFGDEDKTIDITPKAVKMPEMLEDQRDVATP